MNDSTINRFKIEFGCFSDQNSNVNNFDLNNKKWYFITKIVLTYCEKKNSRDLEKLLKFKNEGREFAKILRSLEQFI